MKKIIFPTIIILIASIIQAQPLSTTLQKKMMQTASAISNLYVDTISDTRIIDSSIKGMLKELDPHSTYTPAEEVQRLREPLEGSFEGIGVQFQILEDTINVVQTITGCPAEKVGVLPGDKIIYIENQLVAGNKIQNSDVQKQLRGKRGTEVTIKVKRNTSEKLLDFTIVRDKIPLYSVDASYMTDKNIGFIKINSFGSTTSKEFEKAFEKLKKQGMKDLILSLQMNGGGFLGTAIELADHFLGKGKLIVYTEGEHQPKTTAEATTSGNFETGRLIVLVDEYSASASEIVSGALQDWDRAVIVGRRTFGKGLVQREIGLADGSILRLTTARYYTPSGRCIQKPYNDGAEKYYKDILERSLNGELLNKDSIHFPDSLKYQTKTLHRTVYGGGGITPDVFVPIDTTGFSVFHRKLVAKGLISKVTLQYVNQNRETLKKQYPSFEKFDKNFAVSENMLQKLLGEAEKEKITTDSIQPNNDKIRKEISGILVKNNRKLSDENNNLIDKLITETEINGGESSIQQFDKSKKIITKQMKALIAGDLWGTNEYYQVINSENESLQKAIEILNTPNLYQNILSGK
ncbi:MAG: S41 family peptidase [Paludibacteraceae bacterium]